MKGVDSQSIKRPTERDGKKEVFVDVESFVSSLHVDIRQKVERAPQQGQRVERQTRRWKARIKSSSKTRWREGGRTIVGCEPQSEHERGPPRNTFFTLIQYTADDIKTRVYSEGEQKVFQTYNWLCKKGMD